MLFHCVGRRGLLPKGGGALGLGFGQAFGQVFGQIFFLIFVSRHHLKSRCGEGSPHAGALPPLSWARWTAATSTSSGP